MAYPTPIEWCDATLNLHGGCSIHSPGCAKCYAMQLSGTRLAQHPLYAGTTKKVKGKVVFNGKLTELSFDHPFWRFPLDWKGAREPKLGPGRPSLIFVDDMSDLFHEDRFHYAPDRVFALGMMSKHILQILTKRAGRLAEYIVGLEGFRVNPDHETTLQRVQGFAADFVRRGRFQPNGFGPIYKEDWERAKDRLRPFPLANMWLGFSAERQKEFDERWPHMRRLAEAGWTVFVSIEPMLGPVILPPDFLAFGRRVQVICGGESGRDDPRPMHPDWARALRDQCQAAAVAFFFKQWGEWIPVVEMDGEVKAAARGEWTPSGEFREGDRNEASSLANNFMYRVGKKRAGRLLDGRTWDEFPASPLIPAKAGTQGDSPPAPLFCELCGLGERERAACELPDCGPWVPR